MQGVSAILFVFILAVGFNLASGDLSTSRWYVEKISAVLIGAFGAFVIYQALKSLRPRKLTINAIKPLHQHDEHCGCGHRGVGADLTQGDWKTRLGVILAIGARPCSGAIMILMFSNALGIVTWGIAAVMTMALGTALSIMGLSLAVRYARERTVLWREFVHELAGAGGQNCRRDCADSVCNGSVPDGYPHQRQRRLHRSGMLTP
jgi:ABC-type nickel/cobalt efflux system permease component RcnA